MKPFITFDDNGIGKVSEKKILKSLPEGITNELLCAADDWRETVQAKLAGEALDKAVELNMGNGSGNALTVSDVSLGGRCTASIVVDPCAKLTMEVKYTQSDLMAEVIARSNQLFESKNITPGTDDESET